LENHTLLGQEGSKWRAAFEDLLNASLDKPMNSHPQVGYRWPYVHPQSTATGPGLDWTLSLICRGILPMQFPLLDRAHEWSLAHFSSHPSAHLAKATEDGLIVGSGAAWGDRGCRGGNQTVTLRDLVNEIATPSVPAENQVTAAHQPETEEDLYEALLEVNLAQNARTAQDALQQRMEQEKQLQMEKEAAEAEWFLSQQQADTIDELWAALENGDSKAFAKSLLESCLDPQDTLEGKFVGCHQRPYSE
jgi:hypothetical protein